MFLCLGLQFLWSWDTLGDPLERLMLFSEKQLDKVLVQNKITQDVAERLLNIYVCESDNWWSFVGNLHRLYVKKFGQEEAANRVRTAIAFTILLPAHDKSIKIDNDHPENNLFRWQSFNQLGQKDWFKELQKVVRKDFEISKGRSRLINIGIVDPIDYQPFYRQGFKWLCEEAESSGVELKDSLQTQFRNLVMIYGGAVVSNIFEKHKEQIARVTNWRSPYFFERAIYNVYDLDQIAKIKETEISKTNPKWVKRPRRTS